MAAMDTLKASRMLRDAGIDEKQAEAITQVVSDLAKESLVTKDHLDIRLLQHTLATIAAFATIAGLFKLFS